MQSEEYFKVTIVVNGIKKRARKIDRHFLDAGYLPYNNGFYDVEQVETLAKNFIETNMKEVNGKIQVNLNHITFDGTFGQWLPFSNKNVTHVILSSLEKALM